MNELDASRQNWDHMAQLNPIGAIMYDRPEATSWSMERFFASGAADIDAMTRFIKVIGVAPVGGRALDFGCGIGRLTQGLSRHFCEVYGVDFSEAMLTLAQENCSDPRCTFVLNTSENLEQFADSSFDFIYSTRTLQLIEPEAARTYLREFLRVLHPKGLLVVQVPSHPVPDAPRSSPLLFEGHLADSFAIQPIPVAEVLATVSAVGASVVLMQPDERSGQAWVSFRYFIRKGTMLKDYLMAGPPREHSSETPSMIRETSS